MKYTHMFQGNNWKSDVFKKQCRNPQLADKISITPNHLTDKINPEEVRQENTVHFPGIDSGDGEHTHSWIKKVLRFEDEKAIRVRKELKEQIKEILLSNNKVTNKTKQIFPKTVSSTGFSV